MTTDSTDVDIYYRDLPVEEWPRVYPFLSFAYPGQKIDLNPDTSRLIVAETADGTILAAAIVAVAFHVSYALPLVTDARIDILQGIAEQNLPEKTVYYTLLPDGPDSAALGRDLSMDPCSGVAVYVKSTPEYPMPATPASDVEREG